MSISNPISNRPTINETVFEVKKILDAELLKCKDWKPTPKSMSSLVKIERGGSHDPLKKKNLQKPNKTTRLLLNVIQYSKVSEILGGKRSQSRPNHNPQIFWDPHLRNIKRSRPA